MRLENVPEGLRSRDQWVCWKLVSRGPGRDGAPRKATKVPISVVTGHEASTRRPGDWASWEAACQYMVSEGLDGVGYVLCESDPYVAMDLDGCICNGELDPDAAEVVAALGSYTEVSPSGTGLHIVCIGRWPGRDRCDLARGREAYTSGRYLTVTGDVWGGLSSIESPNGALEAVYRRYWDIASDGVGQCGTAWDSGTGWQAGTLDALTVPLWTRDLVREGRGLAERYGGDRSAALYAVCMAWIRAGVSSETIAEVLIDPGNMLASAALERRDGDIDSARQWVTDYCIRPAAEHVRPDPRVLWGRDTDGAAGQATEPDGTASQLPVPPTWAEFQALDFPAQEPLLGPFSSKSTALVYAPAGAGKTMVMLQVAWGIATGTSVLGWPAWRRARVMYVDGEMTGAMMQHRLEPGVVDGDWLRVANLLDWGAELGPMNLATEAGQVRLVSWVEACGAEVVVLDNLMSLAWVDGISWSSDEMWQPVRRLILGLKSLGVATVVVDHTNKQGSVFGTSTKLWHVDVALRLTGLEGENETGSAEGGCPTTVPRVRVGFDKVRGGTPYADFVVSLGPVGQPWHREEGEQMARRQAREMRENGMSIREIAEELGIPKSTIARWTKGVKG